MIQIIRHLFRTDKSIMNISLKAMLVVSSLYMFAFSLFSPLYAIFVEKIGGDITTAGNAWAVFMLTTGLLTFLTGNWENKVNHTTLGLALSQFLVASTYMMYYFADNVIMLYLAQMLLGMAAAFFWPAFHSLYGKHIDKYNAAKQWSIYDALSYLIPAGAAVAGGWIVKGYGFGTIFIIMAIMSVISGIYILVLPKKIL